MKKRNFGLINENNVSIKVYQNIIDDNGNLLGIKKSLLTQFVLQNDNIILIEIKDKSKFTSLDIHHYLLNLFLSFNESEIEDNEYCFSLYSCLKEELTYIEILDVEYISYPENFFVENNILDTSKNKKDKNNISFKINPSIINNDNLIIIKVEKLINNDKNIFLNIAFNDSYAPLLTAYYNEDEGYGSNNITNITSLGSRINIAVNSLLQRENILISLGEAYSNYSPLTLNLFSTRWDFLDNSNVGVTTLHSYEYFIEELTSDSYEDLDIYNEGLRIYYPNGKQLIYYYYGKDDDGIYHFQSIEDKTHVLKYNSETLKYTLEDLYKNTITFSKGQLIKNSIYSFKIEKIENNNQIINFIYNINELIEISDGISKIEINYLNTRINEINYVNEKRKVKLFYEGYASSASSNIIYRLNIIRYIDKNINNENVENDYCIYLNYGSSDSLPRAITKIIDSWTKEEINISYDLSYWKVTNINKKINNLAIENYTLINNGYNTKIINSLGEYIVDYFNEYGELTYRLNKDGKLEVRTLNKVIEEDDESERKIVSTNNSLNNSLNLLYNHSFYDEINAFNDDSSKGWKIIETSGSVSLSTIVKDGYKSLKVSKNSKVERIIYSSFHDGIALYFNYRSEGTLENSKCKITLNNGRVYEYKLQNTYNKWEKGILTGLEAANCSWLKITFEFYGENLYIDDIELGYEIVQNKNLIPNGFFEFLSTENQNSCWQIENGLSASFIYSDEERENHPKKTFGNYVLKILNENTTPIYKTTFVKNGKKEEVYTLSAMVKGEHRFNSDSIDIELYFDDEKITTLKSSSYNDEWQVLSSFIKAENDFTNISIKIINNTHSPVYIECIQLIKEKRGTYFSYNNKKEIETISNIKDYYYEYNEKGKLISQKNNLEESLSYKYNDKGQLLNQINYMLLEKKITYNNNGNLTKTVVESDHKKIINQIFYDTALIFSPIKTIDELGNETNYEYYESNLLIKEITNIIDEQENKVSFSYDNNNLIVGKNSLLETNYESLLYGYINETYIDQLSYVNNIKGQNQLLFNYDENNRMINLGYKEIGASSSLLPLMQYSYDSNNRISVEQFGTDGDIYTYQYDNKNNLTRVSENNTLKYKYVYDSNNSLVSCVDVVNNYIDLYAYDFQGKLIKSYNKDIEFNYEYDEKHQLKASKIYQNNINRIYNYFNINEYKFYQLEKLIYKLGYDKKLDYIDGEYYNAGTASFGMTYSTSNINLVNEERKVFQFNSNSKMTLSILDIDNNNFLVNGSRNSNADIEDLKHFKWIYMWVKFDENCKNFDLINIYSKLDLNYESSIEKVFKISINGNGELITTYDNVNGASTIPLIYNEWMQLAIAIYQDSGNSFATCFDIFVNGTKIESSHNITQFNSQTAFVNNIYKLEVCSGNSNYKVMYLGVGTNRPIEETSIYDDYDYFKFDAEVLSTIQKELDCTLSLTKNNYLDNTIYYNQEVYANMEVVTLLGDIETNKGTLPYKNSILNVNSNNERKKIFTYVPNEGYLYKAYKAKEKSSHEDNSKLVYKFTHSGNASFGLYFKIDYVDSENERTVISFNNGLCKFFINGDNLKFKFNLTTYTLKTISIDQWHHLTFVKNSSSLIIYLDGVKLKTITPSKMPALNPMLLSLGGTFNETSYAVTAPLDGYTKMLFFSKTELTANEVLKISTKGQEIQYQNQYDKLGRLVLSTPKINGNNLVTTNYQYIDSSINGYTTTRINRYTKIDNTIENIEYNSQNLIKTIGNAKRYGYDKLGRLIIENISNESITYVYKYNDNNNIIEKIKYIGNISELEIDNYIVNGTLPLTIELQKKYKYYYNYQLTDSNNTIRIIKDILAKYEEYDIINNVETLVNTKNLTYASSYYGIPTSITGYIIESKGNKINRLVNVNEEIKYYYNSLGLRTKKEIITNEGTKIYNYYYEGSRLSSYKDGEVNQLYFHYDINGKLIGFHYNGDEYLYVRDVTGTIEKIIDISGTIVATYKYNAWGELISQSGTNNIHTINPILHKGYIYDVETGLFWLSSRYYSPELCRFISPDDVDYLDPESINGLNLYAYCQNDPINYYDPTGHFMISTAVLIGAIIGAVVGAGVGFGIAAYNDYKDDGQIFNGSVAWYDYLGATLLGGTIGAVVGGAIGYGIGYLAGGTYSNGLVAKSVTKGVKSFMSNTNNIKHVLGKAKHNLSGYTAKSMGKLMKKTLAKGTYEAYKTVNSMVLDSTNSQVTYVIINGVIKIGDMWIKSGG